MTLKNGSALRNKKTNSGNMSSGHAANGFWPSFQINTLSMSRRFWQKSLWMQVVTISICRPYCSYFLFVPVRPGSTIGISQKEALYCAIGRCCQRLKEGDIHFEDWVNQILTAEVQLPPESDPLYVSVYVLILLATHCIIILAYFY